MAELECALKCMDAHMVSVLLSLLNEMTIHQCLLLSKLHLKADISKLIFNLDKNLIQ